MLHNILHVFLDLILNLGIERASAINRDGTKIIGKTPKIKKNNNKQTWIHMWISYFTTSRNPAGGPHFC